MSQYLGELPNVKSIFDDCFTNQVYRLLTENQGAYFYSGLLSYVANHYLGGNNVLFQILNVSFLAALTYTENCYQCTYAKRQRVGDITLGDSWGSDLLESEWEKGISLILCQTIKGKRLLDAANVRTSDVDVDNAIKNNHQLEHPSIAPKGKDKFFKGLNQGKSFNKLVMKTLPKACYKQNMKSILIRTGIISRGGISYQIKIVRKK